MPIFNLTRESVLDCFAAKKRGFFAMISVSGMFAVTFSIAFAYVADCTEQSERSTAYGLVRFIPLLVTFMV